MAVEHPGERRVSVAPPRQLIYLYLIAPIVASPLLHKHFFHLPPRRMLLEVLANFLPFLAIPGAIHAFYRFVRLGRGPGAPRFGVYLLLHAAMSALVTALVAIAIHPLYRLLSDFCPQLIAFLPTAIVITWTFILPTLIVQELRVRAEATETAERRVLEQQKTALRAQLEAIQSRTNPHFLFNVLNTIASLVRDDPVLAEATIERLADVLRYSLQSARVERVPLAHEIEMLKCYFEIEQARFGDRLRYTIDVEPGLESLQLPPFLLQPLVENAVLHGIAARPRGGLIRLSARRHDELAELRVEDDGPGPASSLHRGSGTSLHDLRCRLELVYGDACSFVTRSNELGGFTVELLVPTSWDGE
jgi:two-component system sensor histidine kinase AlgZ